MKLNASVGYGITAVAHIASAPSGHIVANSTISEAYKLPERFVLTILRSLVRDGVLTSVRGVRGGYKLGRPASKITLLDIIEAVDGPLQCGLSADLPLAAKANAAVRGAFAAIEAEARERLGAITVAQLKFAGVKLAKGA